MAAAPPITAQVPAFLAADLALDDLVQAPPHAGLREEATRGGEERRRRRAGEEGRKGEREREKAGREDGRDRKGNEGRTRDRRIQERRCQRRFTCGLDNQSGL
eukprot:2989096-Rhodomonas_salina.1